MFAYPKLESVTLPSVESWGVNNNMLRDPPKSITTRRVDKVGQTNYINEMIDGSGDRSCEGIRVYSRGVNPSVSVSYTGNQVGLAGGMVSTLQSSSAKMPYRIMEGGAFRPPILTQRDLLPLSRLPRSAYGTQAHPGLVNYAKTVYAPDNMRMIKDLIHGFDVKPSKSFTFEKPIQENYRMEQAIQHPLSVSASSGVVTQENYEREGYAGDMNRNIQSTPLHTEAYSSKSQHKTQSIESGRGTIQDDRYIQDVINVQASSGMNPTEQKFGQMATPIQMRNVPSHEYKSNTSNPSVWKNVQHTNTLDLQRNLPQTSARTQITKIARFDTSAEIDSRKASNLHGKTNFGSFANEGYKPQLERGSADVSVSANGEKTRVNRFVLDQQMSRYV